MNLPRHTCGLYLEHNPHKDSYLTVLEYLADRADAFDFPNEGERQKAINTDELWTLHWYPDTPVGFLSVAAATLDELLRYAGEVGK
jgi:hypothetical protein